MAKVQATFKCPDALFEARHGSRLCEIDAEILEELFDKYVGGGEYLTVEFDTRAKTATVVAD